MIKQALVLDVKCILTVGVVLHLLIDKHTHCYVLSREMIDPMTFVSVGEMLGNWFLWDDKYYAHQVYSQAELKGMLHNG